MTETRVEDVMTTPMLTLDPETPIAEAADGMLEAEIKSVVVAEEACSPAGIFTSTDALAVLADRKPAAEATVGEYLTEPVETIGPAASIETAADRMATGEFSHLPVIDDDGAGLGILTTTDLAEAVSETESPPLS